MVVGLVGCCVGGWFEECFLKERYPVQRVACVRCNSGLSWRMKL